MSISSRDLYKFKPFVGRVFFLRKNKNIFVSTEKKHGVQTLQNTTETFGEAVYVYDETNTRVQVTNLSGRFLWIPKYNLGKECDNPNTINKDEISRLVTDLLSDKEDCLTKEKKAAIAQLLRRLEDLV